ncbi:MAG: TraB/GumN family protein [Chitinophagaceae bacterium]|nr:TraB/GumN family protein [Chitinophagaceae bacterium]
MRTGTRWFIFTIITLFWLTSSSIQSNAQQEKWPSTFLWKISGNGLKKDSWLYGTIHLQDKRLFNFGDSLYHAIERAEGLAIEINLQEFLDSMIYRMIIKEEDEEEEAVKEEAPLTDAEEKALQARTRESIKARRQKLVNQLKYGEMPTIMDAYLYGIAQRSQKWLGAVEDVTDQLGMLDEFGGGLKEKELLASDKELKFTLEKMIAIYLARDLQGIANLYMPNLATELKDTMMVKRNHKMASSMDSLSGVRSMFFAVGAAHLPGSQGVINLLRKKGYSVTPVFSKKETPAEVYASRLSALPWIKMVENHDSAYTVEIPGPASDITAYGDLVKMKMHYDLNTLTLYMTGHALSQVKEDYLPKLMEEYAKNMNAIGKPRDTKTIIKNGVKGLEAYFNTPDGFFRVQLFIQQNILYLVIAGSEKMIRLMSPDVNKFFQSFAILKRKEPIANGEWKPFTIQGKAFSVSLPGTPRQNKGLEKGATQGGWVSSVYDLMDAENGLYFLVQTRDLDAGYHLNGDTSWFSSFKENFSMPDGFEIDSIDVWEGFPRLQVGGYAGEQKVYLQAMVVLRGSRVYSLMTAGADKESALKVRDQLFGSFRLTDFPTKPAQVQLAPDRTFSSSAAAPIRYKPLEEEEDAVVTADVSSVRYVAYDPSDAVSFVVTKEAISPYAWYPDDSTFFAKKFEPYQSWGDSVIRYKETLNGKLPARDYVVRMNDNHNVKHVRLVLNGDTLFTLFTFIPETSLDEKRYTTFFDEFKVTKEVSSQSIFSDRSGKLKQGLASTDSATFAKAVDAFTEMTFYKKDLPFLHDGLTRIYRDDSTMYYTMQDRIIDELSKLKDPSTIQFIKERYKKIPASSAKVRLGMIAALSGIHTKESYDLIRELLVKDPPSTTTGIYMPYRMMDSLDLGVSLFPDILPLYNHPAWVGVMVDLSVRVLDSARLDVQLLDPYKQVILHHADTSLESIRIKLEEESEEYSGYMSSDLIRLLAYLNDAECQERLRGFLAIDEIQTKFDAALGLARNGQAVDAAIWEELAASNDYRIELYEELEKMDKEALYPAKFRTQAYFAESYLYNYASDDYSPSEMVLLGERKATYKGSLARFFLFKVAYGEEGEENSESYLGMVGPFSLNEKEWHSKDALSMIYWEEVFDKKKVDEWFRSLLKSAQEEE